jgi:hypothetical protein
MMSPIYSNAKANANAAHTALNSNANNSNLNHLLGLSFSASQQPNQPQQKGFLQKKVLPVIRRVGSVAGKISDVAGKVAVVASIL